MAFVPIRNAFLRVSSSLQTRAAAVKQGVCSGEIRRKHDICPIVAKSEELQ